MSYSGHNISASSGAYIPPSIDETDRTAAHANIEINLNIQPAVDSVDSQNQTRMHHDDRKYLAGQPRPLSPPIHTLRSRHAGEEIVPSDEWRENFNALVADLPPDLAEALLSQQGLPKDQRIPSLLILEQKLEDAAKFLTRIRKAAQPEPAGSRAEILTDLNRGIHDHVLKGLIKGGGESLESMRALLSELGRNNPDFEGINHYLQQAEAALDLLQGEA